MVNPWWENSKEGAIALRAPPLGRPRDSRNFYTKGKPNRVIVPVHDERVHTFVGAACDAIAPGLLRATNSPRHESIAICALASEHEDRSRADLTEKSRVASIRSFRSSCLHGARKRARVASSSRRRAGTTNDNAAAAKPVSAAFVGVNMYWTCEHGADQGADTLRCSDARSWRGERSLRLEAPHEHHD